MATIGEPAQPEYDSGEDVIEVEYPPNNPSSASSFPHHNHTAQRNHSTSRHGSSPAIRTHQAAVHLFANLFPQDRHYDFSQSRPARHHHHHHHHHRHSRGSHRPSPASPASQQQRPLPQPSSAIIDLTEEPDTPARARPESSRLSSHPQPQGQHRRHPRRTNSQRISPPTLARSDGNLSIPRAGNMPDYIDLTIDSPEDEQPRQPSLHMPLPTPPFPINNHIFHHHHHHRHHHSDHLVRVDLLQGPGSRVLPDIRGFGRRLAGYLGATDFIGNFAPTRTNAAAFEDSGRASPKPPMEPTPPTRTGFTRDTCAEPEEDRVVICPCCSEELAYDPAGSTTVSALGGASKKRKRTPGEHHFWVLKKCGHVYCADCFENRRPTKANDGVGFPLPPGKSSANDIRCAVDGCDTKVAAKGEWVGIYL